MPSRPIKNAMLLLPVWLVFFAAALTAAQLLGPGDLLPQIALEDQHGNQAMPAPDTRLLLFAPDKAASDLLNTHLAGQTDSYLNDRQAVFLADISDMPGLVTRLFALPAMREYPYPVLLTREEGKLDFIPRRAGEITMIRLHQGRVTDIQYAAGVADLN